MKDYISERIDGKIISRIKSFENSISILFKNRHYNIDNTEKEMNYKLLTFDIRNLKVWKEIKKRNEYYEKRIQK